MSFDPEKVMHYHGWHVDEDPDDTSDRSFHFVSRADYDKLLALLHDVSSEADPAGTLRELRLAQDTIRAQEKLVEELKKDLEFAVNARVDDNKSNRANFLDWRKEHHDPLRYRVMDLENENAELKAEIERLKGEGHGRS